MICRPLEQKIIWFACVENHWKTCFLVSCVHRTLALFLASIGNPAPSTVNGVSANGICRPKFSIAINLFQSTAMPVKMSNSTLLATTTQQGAGLINVYQALTTTALFLPSELSLNDTVRRAASYNVTLWNIGDTTATYKISHRGAALTTGATLTGDKLLNKPLFSAHYAVSSAK